MKLDTDDVTTDPKWLKKQVDRLIGWEILSRFSKNEIRVPMSKKDFSDRIGLSTHALNHQIHIIKKKINGRR